MAIGHRWELSIIINYYYYCYYYYYDHYYYYCLSLLPEQGGRPPLDRHSEHNELHTMSMALFIPVCIIASLGICLALFFLYFNVRNRKKR